MRTYVEINGCEIDFNAAVNLMDNEIREQLHDTMSPCSDQDFIDAYMTAHLDKHGDEFMVN